MTLPSSGAFVLAGDPLGDHLRPISPIYEERGGDTHLWLNPRPEAAGLVQWSMAWVSRSVISTLYSLNSADPLTIDAVTTIVGTAVTWDATSGALVPVERFGAIYLEGPSGERIDGFPLNDELRRADGAVGGQFAILGVPAASAGEVWRLVLVHLDGREDDVFSLRLSPVAGGVMLLEP